MAGVRAVGPKFMSGYGIGSDATVSVVGGRCWNSQRARRCVKAFPSCISHSTVGETAMKQ